MTITFGAAKKEGGGLGEQWSEASDKSLIQRGKFLIYSYLLFFSPELLCCIFQKNSLRRQSSAGYRVFSQDTC